MQKIFMSLLRDEEGQDLIEYTLLMAFISLGSAAIYVSAGNSLTNIWGAGNDMLSNAVVTVS
jgi:Flp pilus assembly pilin Flp